MTATTIAPGARIVVRDAEWLVRRCDRTTTYQAPFDRCDRGKDYTAAWKNFTERLTR